MNYGTALSMGACATGAVEHQIVTVTVEPASEG